MITPAHAFFNWAILRKWFRPWWVVAGSVLPDTPPFVAFFYLLMAKGFPDNSSGGFFGFVMANGNPNNQPGLFSSGERIGCWLCGRGGGFTSWRTS